MKMATKHELKLVERIVEHLAGQHSTAVVLFHQAVAERLGLGPTDHKCLHLLRERGGITGGEPITASKLAAITGLTTGAMTGVIARLEQAGFLSRKPDSQDQRRQILHLDMARGQEIHNAFAPIKKDVTEMLEAFDGRQLAAIAQFLEQSTGITHRHAALLRAEDSFTLDGNNRRRNSAKKGSR